MYVYCIARNQGYCHTGKCRCLLSGCIDYHIQDIGVTVILQESLWHDRQDSIKQRLLFRLINAALLSRHESAMAAKMVTFELLISSWSLIYKLCTVSHPRMLLYLACTYFVKSYSIISIRVLEASRSVCRCQERFPELASSQTSMKCLWCPVASKPFSRSLLCESSSPQSSLAASMVVHWYSRHTLSESSSTVIELTARNRAVLKAAECYLSM